MRTSALFFAKTNFEFLKFIVCPHLTWTGGREEGLSQCLNFFGQGEVSFNL